jgi:uncharacterized membrane protein YbaN (DUF454 family)
VTAAPPSEPNGPERPRRRRGVVRVLWIAAGLVCVAIGGIGIVVPGLPTTVFFVAATWCFARSSPRLEAWVLGLPGVGQLVDDYRAGLGMPRRAKVVAIVSIVVFSSLGIVVLDVLWARITLGVVAAVGVVYVAWRVPTREVVLTRR